MPGSISVLSPELQAEIMAMGERMAELEAAAIPGADWTLSAVDVVQVQLSLSLTRHVPGWPGATDEQLQAVAREIVDALDGGRSRMG